MFVVDASLAGYTQLQVSPALEGLYAGITAFFASFFAFLPNLIAFLLILLVGYLIVRAVIRVLRFAMTKANLERHIGSTDLGRTIERSGHSLSNIVATTVKWLLYLIVVVYAIDALNVPTLTASMNGVLAWIPNLVGVIIIIFAGALIASWVGKTIENTLPRYGVSGGRIIGLAVELIIYAIVFNFALIQLGFAQGILFTITTALSWGLAAALAIGFGVAIAFSLREVLPPMVSGATTVANTLKPGQSIQVEGVANMGNGGTLKGTVRSVGMFNTVIQQLPPESGFVVLPNNVLMDRPIMVRGGEEPAPLEEGLRTRASDLNEKYEQQRTEQSSGTGAKSNTGR